VIARLLALAVLAAVAGGCGEDEPAAPPQQPSIVDTLREGGLVLVLRHAKTDTQTNQQEFLRSCAFQRNLSELGREQAREIGEAIRALRIPIGDVRSSPMCRTRDTARLAFGRVTLHRDLVSPGVIGTEADDERRAQRLAVMVQTPPPAGENTVLVTHTGNIGAALGDETLQEGGMLVYGGGELIDRVESERWAELVEGG
jgi:phosphohistidine phosphatase SixA